MSSVIQVEDVEGFQMLQEDVFILNLKFNLHSLLEPSLQYI